MGNGIIALYNYSRDIILVINNGIIYQGNIEYYDETNDESYYMREGMFTCKDKNIYIGMYVKDNMSHVILFKAVVDDDKSTLKFQGLGYLDIDPTFSPSLSVVDNKILLQSSAPEEMLPSIVYILGGGDSGIAGDS